MSFNDLLSIFGDNRVKANAFLCQLNLCMCISLKVYIAMYLNFKMIWNYPYNWTNYPILIYTDYFAIDF